MSFVPSLPDLPWCALAAIPLIALIAVMLVVNGTARVLRAIELMRAWCLFPGSQAQRRGVAHRTPRAA